MAEKKTIRISVRNLVEFVMRGGDLDNRRGSGAEKAAMQEGSRIHRKIQKSMDSDYKAEVMLRHIVEEDGFEIQIEGRADGILEKEGVVTIDEIKGIYLDLSLLEVPVAVHKAQAMCYGYIYCRQKQIEEAVIQLTYCNLDTEEIKRFHTEITFLELEEWFNGLIHEYLKWAEYLYLHGIRRDQSIGELEFPFPYREGQKELAVSVYRAIARKKNLFIQAPTGIGKTLSTIFPSLKAMGEGCGDKLFYLTAKSITRAVAEDAYESLRKRGLYFKNVTLTAKDKLCFLDEPKCNPEDCPYAKGHFDRVNDAVYDVIHKEFGITRELVLSYAQTYKVCPFEFCLDISSWVDGIICDYNYVFDPNVRLKRYFSEGISGEYIFLTDEAHNLVSRAREMYSAILYKEDILLAKRVIGGRSPKVTRHLERINKTMLEMKRECESYEIFSSVSGLAAEVMALFGELETFMEVNKEFEDRDLVLDFYFMVRDFLNIYDRVDDNYRIYGQIGGDGRFMVRLFCINPYKNLRECLDKGNSTVFFSATLLPVMYYKELLSGNTEDYAVYAHSPFDTKKRMLLVGRDISSRYSRRNRREYEKTADYIRKIVSARMGNYMVFLPSYQYMRELEQILTSGEEFSCIFQSSNMREAEREEFLGEFEKIRDRSFVAFCVMGGVFSEGIDLKEERLIGAIIVGTGLPMVCPEQEILKEYFDGQGKRGFDYAYIYPGMNKVMQAAGRVIRTAADQGVVALLDDRFLGRDCQSLFPREWEEFSVVDSATVEGEVKRFWRDIRECP